MDRVSESGQVNANRLCLDFANLPYTSGDPTAHQSSWLELVDFLAEKGIISCSRSENLRALTETDPRAAVALIRQAQRLRGVLRLVFSGMMTGQNLVPEH